MVINGESVLFKMAIKDIKDAQLDRVTSALNGVTSGAKHVGIEDGETEFEDIFGKLDPGLALDIAKQM